jgi:small GTP-binding protein
LSLQQFSQLMSSRSSSTTGSSIPAALEHYDYRLKLIIIGDANSGKSCLLEQFREGRFFAGSTHTIGVEFASKIVSINDKRIKLQIWDTAGQDRYRTVSRSYYRGALGAIVVYDITSRESFNNLPRWIQDAREQASKEVTIAVVGNKRDLSNERAVPMLDASRFCQERDLLFMETSALTGEGVVDIFELLTRRIIDKIQSGQIDPKSVANGILADHLTSRKDSPGDLTVAKPANGGLFSRFFKFLFSSCDPGNNDLKSL